MEKKLDLGAFEVLNQQEMFLVDGGDKARQQMVAAHKASGTSLGSTKSAINAQTTVTGFALAIAGVATGGGVGLVLAAVGLVYSSIGVSTL